MSDESAQSTAVDVDRSRQWKLAFGIAVLVLAVAGPVMHPRGGLQQASRYALTAALWDHNTVALDDYRHVLGRDHAIRDGVVYSDKAPGQPFLAVPFYAAYRLAGGEPAEEGTIGVDWGLWWMTLWMAAVPAAVLSMLMYSWTREIEPHWALSATLATSFGTLLLVYSTLLYGHVLAALFGFGMFLLIRERGAHSWKLFLAGLLGGAAVLTEYPTALIVGVLVVASLIRHRIRTLSLLAGGIPAVIFLGWYHWRVTGSPFVHPYQWTGFNGPREAEGTTFHMFVGPEIDRLIEILFSPRGLLIATPIVVLGVIGAILLFRRGNRFDALIPIWALVSLVAVQTAWSNSFAGGAGPRYVTPALPFLVAPLAVAWGRWWRPALMFAVLSVLTMTTAALTNPEIASRDDVGIALWLNLAINGDFAPRVFTEILGGLPGALVYVLTIMASVAWLITGVRSQKDAERVTTAHSKAAVPGLNV